MTSYIIFGITYGFIAGVQPGPLQTYIISQTIKRGWKSTLPAAFAPVISDIPIFIITVLILSIVPENFLYVLRIMGGMFLLFLAFKAYASWQKFDYNEQTEKSTKIKALLNAVVVNLLNPNPYIGWSLIMGPLFLEGWSSEHINGISLIASFYFTLVLFLAMTIIIFGFARRFGPKFNRLLLGLSSLALMGFGIYQLTTGIIYFL
jgi:threonine/homoserine/homoserine lactone efflux protein